MVSRDFQTLTRRRAERARELAERVAAAREPLEFVAGVFALQASSPTWQQLADLTLNTGSAPLREAAGGLDETRFRQACDAYLAGEDRDSPAAFIARCSLQVQIVLRPIPEASGQSNSLCPRCGEPPQGGVLRPLAHGNTLSLFCSLCLAEWPFVRGRCPGCGETAAGKLGFHSAQQFPHIQTMTCDGCRGYLHLIDLSKEPEAVPDVDEIAAMSLDIWANEQGYSKLQPNLIGL